MPKGRRRRWRDQRDTLPARRRRRRAHRRDRQSSRHYYPMKVEADSASRGIRARLLGAMASALVTVICVVSLFLAPELTLGSTLAITVALGSLGLSIALTMSARREEIVHQVASRLSADETRSPPALPPPNPTFEHPEWFLSEADDEDRDRRRSSVIEERFYPPYFPR